LSKLNEIQAAIQRLDGGQFQKLMDTYIYKKFGYKYIMDLGSHSGTNKTTRGIPDTYFPLENGKYVFVMYGAHDNNVFSKIKSDIEDCLSINKTGIEVSQIQQIICCHTSSNINARQDMELRKICSDKGVLLDIVGIGNISQDLLNYYPIIAKKELGVTVDTGQMLYIDDFIKAYDENPMVTPIGMGIHGRDKEIQELLEKMNDSKVLMVYGNSGVGKTRLCIEACRVYVNINRDVQCYCIKNNGNSLYEDLKTFIDIGKEYLVFIDDANQTSDLSHLIEYVNKKEFKVKIVISVRDYAKEHAEKIIKKFNVPDFYFVNPMTNEQIDDIIKKELNITNTLYLDQIKKISKGNPRLAIQAGRLSKEKSLKGIMNAEQLYEDYYSAIIEEIDLFHNGTAVKIAGLISFFYTINLEDKELEKIVLLLLGVNRDEFDEVINRLHYLEIVDRFENSAVKVSEQSMSNYFLYYVFAKNRLIKLSDIIRTCFPVYKQKISYAINTIMKLFCSEELNNYLFSEIGLMWDEYSAKDKTIFIEYMKMFYPVRELETLKYINDFTDRIEAVSFDASNIKFEQMKNNQRIDDIYLNILSGFKYSSNRKIALELLIKYYKKRPDMFMEFYFSLVDGFGIDRKSQYNDYIVQQEVIEVLISETKGFTEHNVNMLFFRVADTYLDLVFNHSEESDGRSITFYTIPVIFNKGAKKYRDDIWNALSQLFSKSDYQDLIIKIIENYRTGTPDYDIDIVRSDLEGIYNFIRFNLDKKNFKHCRLVNRVCKLTSDIPDGIRDFLNNETLIVYKLLKGQRHFEEFDYHKERELKKVDIKEYFSGYITGEFSKLLDMFAEIQLDNTREEWELNEGISMLFELIVVRDDIYPEIIREFIKRNTPLNPYPNQIVSSLIRIVGDSAAYQLLCTYDYKQKPVWLRAYFGCLDNEQINKINLKRLHEFLFDDVTVQVGIVPDLHVLEKFKTLDNEIVVETTDFLIKKNRLDTLAYFMRYCFHDEGGDFNKLLQKYSSNLDVLKKAYFLSLKFDKNIDYNSWVLKNMINFDPNFLKDFIRFTVENSEPYHNELPSLSVIWSLDNWEQLVSCAIEEYIKRCGYNYWNIIAHLGKVFNFKEFTDINEEDTRAKEFPESDKRQDIWIKTFINKYCLDKERIEFIFNVISHFNEERRIDFICYFVEKNDSFEFFKDILLEPSSFKAGGSFIPVYEKKKAFVEKLLPHFNGLRFIEHRNLLEQRIESLRKSIKHELHSEFLEER
jgi:hypothetical protein